MLVFNGSHYEPLNVDTNGRLDANIFSSSNLNVDIASSSATISVDGSGFTQPISASTLPLPTGAATEATLSSVDTKLAGTIAVDGSAVTQPVSISTVPLPTGAATETTLSSISTDVSTLANTVNAGGEQKVSVSSENFGSHGNIANNITLNTGSVTSSVSISEIARGNLFYTDSNIGITDGIEIQVSEDNVNWYSWGQLYPYTPSGSLVRTDSVIDGSAHGLRYVRIKNISTTTNYTNVICSLFGSH